MIFGGHIKMKKHKKSFIISSALLVAFGVASWSLYSLANKIIEDILLHYGITNFYYQNLIVLGIIFGLAILFGYRKRNAIKKIIG